MSWFVSFSFSCSIHSSYGCHKVILGRSSTIALFRLEIEGRLGGLFTGKTSCPSGGARLALLVHGRYRGPRRARSVATPWAVVDRASRATVSVQRLGAISMPLV